MPQVDVSSSAIKLSSYQAIKLSLAIAVASAEPAGVRDAVLARRRHRQGRLLRLAGASSSLARSADGPAGASKP